LCLCFGEVGLGFHLSLGHFRVHLGLKVGLLKGLAELGLLHGLSYVIQPEWWRFRRSEQTGDLLRHPGAHLKANCGDAKRNRGR
jgi:hypothetical protein